jgi:DNA-binding transcriptional LysR family regulator
VFKARHLRYFVTVVEEGQITRAAAKLHMAQPALSQAIAHLEAQLGLQLLTRHTRGVALTPGGEIFFEKARVVVDAEREAVQTVEALARGEEGTLVFGSVGLPPWLASPDLVEAFGAARPNAEIRVTGVPFPSVPIASWLADVDVMISTVLSPDQHVWVQPLGTEQRVVLAAKGHRLGRRSELMVSEVLDETFIRSDPTVDPVWAGNWSLDDHRGGPPSNLTAKASPTTHGTIATIASGAAISTSPASQATPIVNALPGVVAIPLRGARPMILSLVGHKERSNPLVKALRDVARSLVRQREPGLVEPAD